jgi:endonuclease/exonuclease/phosphatase (EEP) superfamily protein YafD
VSFTPSQWAAEAQFCHRSPNLWITSDPLGIVWHGGRVIHPTRALRLAVAASTLLATLGTCFVVLNLWPDLQQARVILVLLAAFIPYGVLAWGLAALGFAVGGRRRIVRAFALPCLAAMLLQVWWTQPYWPHAAPAASGSTLRVLSLNLNFGKADPAELAGVLSAERPDVVVLLEVQVPILESLTKLGALASYTYSVGNAPLGFAIDGFESDQGTYVLSRTPLAQLERLDTPNGQYVVRVQRPGGDVAVIAARPRNVLLGIAGWVDDYAALTDAVGRYSTSPLVVAGDLNATHELAPFRRLLAVGLTDAAAQSGVGWLPTYSAEAGVPLIAIDHVLCNSRVTALAIRTFRVGGTDHLGLVADLVTP